MQILLTLLTIITIGMGTTGGIAYWVVDHSVRQNAAVAMHHKLEERLHAIHTFDTSARQAILFAMECPAFGEYFSLPESLFTTDDAHKPISFTDQQKKLLQPLERIGRNLHDHFPIVETCLVDRLGREHLRLTRKKSADSLDIHEDHLSFFQESLRLGKGETLVTPPYFSPDYQDWVVAYTSPVILPEQPTPAFFHFEIPLSSFQAIVTRDGAATDRYLLLNAAGIILADSARLDRKPHPTGEQPLQEPQLDQVFPNVDGLFQNALPASVLDHMKQGHTGENQFDQQGEAYQIFFQSLKFLDWRIAIVKPHEHFLEGTFSFDQILAILTLTPLLMLVLGAIGGAFLARSLARPLQRLSAATREIGQGRFEPLPPVSSNTEISQLTASFNQMVHELHDGKKKLLAAKQRTEQILDTMEDVFMVLSPEGVIQEINHAEPLRRVRETIIGQPAALFFHESAFLAMPTFMEQVQEGGIHNLENELVTGGGDPIPVLVSASRMVDVDGVTIGILLIAHNITAYRQAQEAIQEKNARLLAMEQIASRAKSDFVANLSHEIRTPMNAILCLTDLALRTSPDSNTREYLRKVETASQSLMGCLNDILDFSKIEAGKLELYPVMFNPSNLFRNLADIFGDQAANKGIELLFIIPNDYFQTLFGDAKRLEQILINLLRNAIKFTAQGTVIVRAHPHPHLQQVGPVILHFSVEDTGIGIAPERVDALFTPFTQADPSIALQYGGTGLGLNICKQLVKMMRGRIWVESVPQHGSRFDFTVQLEHQPEINKTMNVPDHLRDKRILVVDDHEMTRKIMEEILRGLQFTTHSVDSGEAAMTELLDAHAMGINYHLVFMDWRLSGMDGIEAVQAIRQRFAQQIPPLPLPKMVMLTAFGKHTVQQSAEQSGVDLFLHKPVTRVALFNAILQLFGEPIAVEQTTIAIKQSEEWEASLKVGGARVLLAEDNYINQQVAMTLLQRVGVTVEVANNGQEALQMLETTQFDAVLMDLQMPKMNGHTATQHIRQNPRFTALPVIAMTAHALEGTRESCLASGMNDYLTKPIDTRRLYAVLAQWINPDGSHLRFGRPSHGVTHPIQETTPLPPLLPGIDLQNALVRMGGDAAFLKSMLLRFQEHAHVGKQIETALQHADLDTARNLVHTITGVAGNLSATRLQQAAHNLEQAIEQENLQQEPFLLIEFKQALQQVLNTVHGLEPGDKIPGPATNIAAIDETELKPLLRELSTFLELRDTDAELTLDTLKHVMNRKSWQEDMQKLEEHVQRLDYPGAQKLLQKIQENLQSF